MTDAQGETMKAPDEVAAMVRLRALGWGVRRIATELGCSHMTVRRYLAEGGWVAYRAPRRAKALDGLEDWLAERFRRHRGNRSEEHTSELQSRQYIVCRLLL